MLTPVSFLKDLRASIPSRLSPDWEHGLIQRLPEDLVYHTITGWKVKRWSGMVKPETLPPRTWWRKAYWDIISLFIVLPHQVVTFVFTDLPHYGCYVIWVEAIVYPYYRQDYNDWWTESEEITVTPDDEHAVTFTLRGLKYVFHDCNCILPKNEPGRIRVRLHQPSINAKKNETTETEEEVQVMITEILWHRVRQAQFSCFKTLLKMLLGMLWLQCVFVPTANLFFLLGALIVEGCKRASIHGVFWFQKSPLHLVDDWTIWYLFEWRWQHALFILNRLGSFCGEDVVRILCFRDRHSPPVDYVAQKANLA